MCGGHCRLRPAVHQRAWQLQLQVQGGLPAGARHTLSPDMLPFHVSLHWQWMFLRVNCSTACLDTSMSSARHVTDGV